MLLVGLTGGIGSGKSTVARMLEERGAIVFDADALARRAVEPGTPGHDAVVERFGANVLGPGGELDREALASIVFADPAARRDLEAIVHPEVRRLFAEGASSTATPTEWWCSVRPSWSRPGCTRHSRSWSLWRRRSMRRWSGCIRDRAMTEEAIRARIAAQAPLEDKLAVADVVVGNDGSLEELEEQVEGVDRPSCAGLGAERVTTGGVRDSRNERA